MWCSNFSMSVYTVSAQFNPMQLTTMRIWYHPRTMLHSHANKHLLTQELSQIKGVHSTYFAHEYSPFYKLGVCLRENWVPHPFNQNLFQCEKIQSRMSETLHLPKLYNYIKYYQIGHLQNPDGNSIPSLDLPAHLISVTLLAWLLTTGLLCVLVSRSA